MALLSDEELRALHHAALDARLGRDTLLEGINPFFAAGIPSARSPSEQIFVDLQRMSRARALTDGSVPLLTWLYNAVTLAASLPEMRIFSEAHQRVRGEAPRTEPAYPDVMVKRIVEDLERERERRRVLERAGVATDEVNLNILKLRRALREGGRLCPGDTLKKRWALLEVIGKGGFATVYKARDQERGTIVAIKVLHASLASDEVRRERFFRGARTMAELDHPAIVKVLWPKEEEEGYHFFIMEHVEGEDLFRAVTGGRLDRDRVIPLVLSVGEGLAAAHAKGLVHRDVKPANILLDGGGNPKLTDFDLVAAQNTTGGTRTGALGTFLFAAPESLDKPQDADARADVYGLAMTAVFALYGKALPTKAFRSIEPFVDGLACNSGVKKALKRALAWEKEERFISVTTFCEALSRAAGVTAPPPSPVPGSERGAEAGSPRGRRWMVGGLVAVSAVGVLATVVIVSVGVKGALPTPMVTAAPTPVVSAPQGSAVTEALAAIAQAPILLTPGCPAEMATILGGTFKMGSNDYTDEQPVHDEIVKTFCLDKTEVTVEAYKTCKECTEPSKGEYCNWGQTGKEKHPINCVDWRQAKIYCAAKGKRLPTEAQWELTARGLQGRTYPWGEDKPASQLCWNGEGNEGEKGKRRSTCEVGVYIKDTTKEGVADLAGNVWEWVEDYYCPYDKSKECDKKARVIRGGSWNNENPSGVRGVHRYRDEPGRRYVVLGFRCAR